MLSTSRSKCLPWIFCIVSILLISTDLVVLRVNASTSSNGNSVNSNKSLDSASQSTTTNLLPPPIPPPPKTPYNPNGSSTSPVSGRVTRASSSSSSSQIHKKKNKDSLEQFQNDITYILKDLLVKEYDYQDDPTTECWNNNKIFETPIYNKESWWNEHISPYRYIKYVVDMPLKSQLLKRVLPQMIVLGIWSIIVTCLNSQNMLILSKLNIGLSSMSLVSTFVAALLTLRGNQGLSRLAEARKSIAQINVICREMAQLMGTYVYPQHNQLGLFAARHIAIFAWVLKTHLQGKVFADNNDKLLSTILPNHPEDVQYITNYKYNPPVAILQRLRQIICFLGEENQSSLDSTNNNNIIKRPILSREQYKSFCQMIWRLNESIMYCERIKISPIPPLYTTHMTRLLIFYLFWLPIVLSSNTTTNPIATIIITIVVGYAMLGLDEISHILELPFRFMPLRQLSKISMMECADAIVYRPPKIITIIDETDDEDNNGNMTDGSTTRSTTSILKKSSGAYLQDDPSTTRNGLTGSSINNDPSYW